MSSTGRSPASATRTRLEEPMFSERSFNPERLPPPSPFITLSEFEAVRSYHEVAARGATSSRTTFTPHLSNESDSVRATFSASVGLVWSVGHQLDHTELSNRRGFSWRYFLEAKERKCWHVTDLNYPFILNNQLALIQCYSKNMVLSGNW
ncbi:unnamed protein product [Timema podura]|uniref:Uncharacterized protein n=1 Tax=Timema podura TaxID=61482 RepID=A0ABN7NQP5_TIMPD|nr:unnamed protein product [Timema podura]